MLEKIREKLLAFIESDKDVPLLAGFSVGFYMMLFYYSKNFALANSWPQFLFFTGYYVMLPVLSMFFAYKAMSLLKLGAYKKNVLFVGVLSFFSFYFLQVNSTGGFSKKILFIGIFIVACVISIRFKKYYKLFIILLFLMSLFNVKPLVSAGWAFVSASQEWKKQPDDIENVKFKKKPNIYYIQPDGYTSFDNLKNNKYYQTDNSDYITFLKNNDFVTYDDYRSNYYSTLLSNSATFTMKHHYLEISNNTYGARAVIMGDNPVLKVLKNNGYKTNFISESPYLLINRPKLGYDYANISFSELPYLKDGFSIKKDVTKSLKFAMQKSSKSGNFYFIEKFVPGHIAVYQNQSQGKAKEKERYLKRIHEANVWLKEIVSFISVNDTSGIIIIGADHGGFTGFEYSAEVRKKVTDNDLIKSVFGAQLAIKWNSISAIEYDRGLKSGVNLFRTVFSFLAEDKKYLTHLQENSSYMMLTEPRGFYRYINNDGDIVFEKR